MGVACRISVAGDRVSAYNVDGSPSQLYREALDFTDNNQLKALDIWSATTLPEFQEATGKINNNDDVTLDEALKHFNTLASQDTKLSTKERYDVEQFMYTNGFSKLSDLSDTLNRIFRADGKIGFDSQEAISSGLYNQSELNGIDLESMASMLIKIDGQLIKEDIAVEPTEEEFTYTKSGVRTALGNFEKISEEQIYRELRESVEDLSSPQEISEKVAQLGYSDFAEKFNNDPAFAKNVLGRFEGLVKLPLLIIQNGKLAVAKSDTFSTVKNTIRTDVNPVSVEAITDYLLNIDEDIWVSSKSSITAILKQVESDMIGMGIDVIGLSDKAIERDSVLSFMEALNTLVKDAADKKIDEKSILDFAEAHDALIEKKSPASIEKLEAKYKGLTIVKMYTDLSDNELFEKHGLIKLEDTIYHKIKRENTDDLIEYILQNKDIKLPDGVKTEAQIREYISGRDTGLDTNYSEEISLNQIVFNHTPIVRGATNPHKVALLEITANAEYLKTDFVSDFYEEILKEKHKDSNLYREKLSKFKITDRDITLTEPISGFEGITSAENLKDYFRLKKDMNMKYLVPSKESGVSSDLWDLNSTREVQEYLGSDLSIDSGYVLTPPNSNKYIKVRGKLYEKTIQKPNIHLYSEVITIGGELYYNLDNTVRHDSKLAEKLATRYDKLTSGKSNTTSVSEALEKAGRNTPFMTKLLQDTKKAIKRALNFNISEEVEETSSDKVFENNLVGFIRSKGVSVVTDPTEVKRVLAESGIDTVNPSLYPEYTAARGKLESIRKNDIYNKELDDYDIERINNKLRKISNDYGANDLRLEYGKYGYYIADNRGGGVLSADYTNSRSQFGINFKRSHPKNLGGFLNFQVEGAAEGRVNFLQTPAGNVLGFEKNGVIYLDEAQLNNTTTVHELVHVFQSMIDIKAAKGDKKAQDIIAKRKELFQSAVDEWKKFHEGKVGVGEANVSTMTLPNGEVVTVKATESQQLKDTLGLDLSSPAYAQRPGELNEDWNTRLLKEVEAYVTAPEISAKLEELKNNDPSLWQKITDFIKQLTDWLKSQIGLSDYKGDIMDMTKEEYTSALGISVLKDDYLAGQSEVKPEVEKVFNENLELAEIGNVNQYSQYLDSVFPDSQVKDIVFQGVNNIPEGSSKYDIKYNKSMIGTGSGRGEAGFFFSESEAEAKEYGSAVPIVIDVKNIDTTTYQEGIESTSFKMSVDEMLTFADKYGSGVHREMAEIKQKGGIPFDRDYVRNSIDLANQKGNDSVLLPNVSDRSLNRIANQYIVFEPEQIHVLGSKQDIESFRKFIGNSNAPATESYESIQNKAKDLQAALDYGIEFVPLSPESESENIYDKMNDCE